MRGSAVLFRRPVMIPSPSPASTLSELFDVPTSSEKQIAAVREWIGQAAVSGDERNRAIGRLAGRKRAGFDDDLRALVGDALVCGAAICGLANYGSGKTPAAILDVYGKLTSEEKTDAVQTLASRASYATHG